MVLALVLAFQASPAAVAGDDTDAARTMTRLFKAYAKFKMADYQGAKEIWEAIGAKGRGEALFNLGILYEDGLGVEADTKQALDLYTRAATTGSRSAQYRLGLLLSDNDPAIRDIKAAKGWLKLAASQGDEDAGRLLATLEGSAPSGLFATAERAAVAGDHENAVHLYRELADAGDVRARTRLAWLYEAGSGVERDLSKAAALFRQSADNGDAEAQYAYAVMLRTGTGTEKDVENAAAYLHMASDQGYAPAEAALQTFK